MPIFHDPIDPADNEAFLAWIGANPQGYYLNLKKPREAMLHRGRCFHIEFNIPVRSQHRRRLLAQIDSVSSGGLAPRPSLSAIVRIVCENRLVGLQLSLDDLLEPTLPKAIG